MVSYQYRFVIIGIVSYCKKIKGTHPYYSTFSILTKFTTISILFPYNNNTFSKPRLQFSQPILLIFLQCLPSIFIKFNTNNLCQIQIVIKIYKFLIFSQPVHRISYHQGKLPNVSRPGKAQNEIHNFSQNSNRVRTMLVGSSSVNRWLVISPRPLILND